MFCPVRREEILKHDATLRRLARTLVSDAQTADDVVQDAWVAALEKPPTSFRSKGGWLKAVTRYTASRTHRNSKLRLVREQNAAKPDSQEEEPIDAQTHQLELLGGAIGALREPYRSVIELRFFEGLSIAGIADRLKRPRGTIQSQIKRGLDQLRDRLDRANGGRAAWAVLFLPTPSTESTAAAASKAGPSTQSSAAVVGIGVAAAVVLLVAVPFVLSTLDAEPDTGTSVASAPLLGQPVLAAEEEQMPDTVSNVERLLDLSARGPNTGTATPLPPPTLLIRALDRSTGSPVAQLDVRLEALGARTPPDRQPADSQSASTQADWNGTTGADGQVLFEGLAAGRWRLVPQRGLPLTLDVAPHGPTSETVWVHPGIEVVGMVFNGSGQPYPKAELWASYPDEPHSGRVVGTTAHDGSFELDGLDPRSWICARAPGYAPSRLLALTSPLLRLAPETPLALRLGPATPLTEGTITDAGGVPVAGALVTLGVRPLAAPRAAASGFLQRRPPPHQAWSDERGAFAIASFQSVEAEVRVEAPGFAPWYGKTVDRHPLAIELERGSELSGRVLVAAEPDGSLRPVADATVLVTQGEGVRVQTRSDAEGRYSLPHLMPGKVAVRATWKSFGSRTDVELPDRTTFQRDLLLDRQSGVHGQLLDAAGLPLAGWRVELRDPAPRPDGSTRRIAPVLRTDSDGTFFYAALPIDRVRALALSPPGRSPASAAQLVRAGEETLVLRAQPHTARIAGRLAVSREDQARGILVELRSPRLEAPRTLPWMPGDGSFACDELPPGAFTVHAAAVGSPFVELAAFELGAGAEHHLGLLAMPGSAELDIRFRPIPLPEDLAITLTSDSKQLRALPGTNRPGIRLDAEGRLQCPRLEPGRYHLRVEAPRIETIAREIHIEPGAQTQLELELRPAGRVELELRAPAPLAEGADFVIEIRRGTELELVVRDRFAPAARRGPFFTHALLAPGDYRIDVETEAGWKASAEFTKLPLSNPARESLTLVLQ